MSTRRPAEAPMGTGIDMTPLIDIVFQLLVFFVMTFRFAEQETEFQIRSPLRVFSTNPPNSNVPLLLQVAAGPDRNVAAIRLNGERLGSWNAVTERLLGILGGDRGPGSLAGEAEIEIACAPELRYEEAVRALDAVSGIRHEDGTVTQLIEKVRFVETR